MDDQQDSFLGKPLFSETQNSYTPFCFRGEGAGGHGAPKGLRGPAPRLGAGFWAVCPPCYARVVAASSAAASAHWAPRTASTVSSAWAPRAPRYTDAALR
jgi:hypothetical protein